MSVTEYGVMNDYFQFESKGNFDFPCCVCVHIAKDDSEHPCTVCGHNEKATEIWNCVLCGEPQKGHPLETGHTLARNTKSSLGPICSTCFKAISRELEV